MVVTATPVNSPTVMKSPDTVRPDLSHSVHIYRHRHVLARLWIIFLLLNLSSAVKERKDRNRSKLSVFKCQVLIAAQTHAHCHP